MIFVVHQGKMRIAASERILGKPADRGAFGNHGTDSLPLGQERMGVMTTKLFVIRHGHVERKPDVPPELWPLSLSGALRTAELARGEDWRGVGKLYHSPELKARETGEIISRITGIPLQPLADLRDVSPLLSPAPESVLSRADRTRYVGEDPREATDRIVDCILRLVKRHKEQTIGIISHARILALFYSHILQRKISLLEWFSIPLPGVSVIDVDQWKVIRGFLSPKLNEYSQNGNCDEPG
ncbi:MAG: hypothetical protein C7B43_03125 [Sulfobacillus benefaciens]|jgi:broad specificity phosphatase PhoE|uniref:Histidine phosphatase family protein n=1 Tax=Sulfobacillus benefaciens TaxID=453960 RepID=A0A2T2X9H8_9FIRM|nr:MAG: hypothetical protein C7B43_03125 [Sulfobacillus benefaciens]